MWWLLRHYVVTIRYLRKSFSVRFGIALVDSNVLTWHRSILVQTSHHFSGALEEALIILLLIGVLVGTLDIHSVLGALIISNCRVRSPGFLQVWFPLHFQVCFLTATWVQISLSSEFACRFISKCCLPALLLQQSLVLGVGLILVCSAPIYTLQLRQWRIPYGFFRFYIG